MTTEVTGNPTLEESSIHCKPTLCSVLTGGHVTVGVPSLHHLLDPLDPLDRLLDRLLDSLLSDITLGVHRLAIGSVVISKA